MVGLNATGASQQATMLSLNATVASQQTTIAALEQKVAELEAKSGRPRGMPGNKMTPRRTSGGGSSKPRKRRLKGFGRSRMEPTDRVEHALDNCPDCGTGLSGGWKHRSREVIDIPEAPAVVTEHVVIARNCPRCRMRRMPSLNLGDVVIGRQRLGIRLISLMVALRNEARMPIEKIRWYLQAVHDLKLSTGAIVAAIHQAAEMSVRAVEQIRDRVRGSPVVFADETGWRQDGVNGFVWTFSTPNERYFIRRDRTKAVVDEALGEDFSGVLVSDFYAAYNHYPGLKQRCWVHLLRDIHDLKQAHPEDSDVTQWAGAVKAIYEEAKAFSSADARSRSAARRRFQQRLLTVCRPHANDEDAPQRTLCQRVERFIKELFVFVAEPYVPSDNNAAERSLRPLLVSRKISGGTRSERGTASTMALASIFGTWNAQGINPLIACRQILASHQV